MVYEVPSMGIERESTRILNGVSGFVASGESLAILGPSGSGKTTLLNLLAGQSMYAPVSGKILFWGKERTARTKRSVGYVMQDDLFLSNLTVRETLEFTAKVRLPTEMPSEKKMERVDSVINSLRLRRCQNTQIGNQITSKGISGGERKRLNIANELIPDPLVLLGDECTSGLDSASAATVVEHFRDLSDSGKTVMCTIHQPSSYMFHMFDKVLLLASGRVAYFGTPSGVSSYFSHIGFPFPSASYNPSDSMLDLVIDDLPNDDRSYSTEEEIGPNSSQDRKKRVLDAWKEHGDYFSYRSGRLQVHNHRISELVEIEMRPSTEVIILSGRDIVDMPKKGPFRALSKRYWALTGQQERDPLLPKYPSSFFIQVLALGQRSLLQKRGNLLDRVVIVQLLAITFAFCCFWFRIPRNESTISVRLGAIFFFNLFWGFFSTFAALGVFPNERMVVNKDRASGSYRLLAYYIAKTSVEIPADVLYPTCFATLTYFTVNLNPSFSAFILHTTTLLLTVIASVSLGTTISATVTSSKEASALCTVLIISSSLISGYYIEKSNLPVFVRWLRQLSFLKFGYEAMVRIEAKNQIFPCVEAGAPHTKYSKNGMVCPVSESAFLEGVDLDDHIGIAANLACLLCFIIVVRVLGYFSLKYLNKPLRAKKFTSTKE